MAKVISSPPGFRLALALFQQASERVPAYKDFLKKHQVQPSKIKTYADWQQLPQTNKPDYINKYSLPELCWEGNLLDIRHLPMSSGSTGLPQFWPTTDLQEQASWRYLESALS